MLNQELFDELLDQSINLLRLSAGERKRVFALLQQLEKDVLVQLDGKELSKLKRRELNKVLVNINETTARYYNQIAVVLDTTEIARYVSSSTSYALEISLGIESAGTPKQDYFNALAKNLIVMGYPQADWWRGQSVKTARNFTSQVRQGLMANETNQQIISRIVGKNGLPGIMETSKREAASLVQTSVQSVANDARRETFKTNSDVIKGLRQVSTLDSHTSLTCVAYSEAEWDLDYKPIGKKKLPFNGGCPRHFNCRSIEVPITKTFRELGIDLDEPKPTTRASSDGQISADTTFQGYLDRKSKLYQDEVLGVGRADLWRAGKITLRDLVDGNGRPLTLAQLKELAKKRN